MLTVVKRGIRFNNNASYIIRNFVDSPHRNNVRAASIKIQKQILASIRRTNKTSFNALLSIFCPVHMVRLDLGALRERITARRDPVFLRGRKFTSD